TTVNGRRVQTADLHDGDVIGIGHTSLVVGLAAGAETTAGPAAADHATPDLPAPPATVPLAAVTLDLPVGDALPPTVPETRFPSAVSGVSDGPPAVPETRFPTGVST